MQIEVQATTGSQLPKKSDKTETSEETSQTEAKALTDGSSQSGPAGYHDVSPNSSPGNGKGQGPSNTSGTGSSESSTSGRQSDTQGGESTTEDSSKQGTKASLSQRAGARTASSSSNPSGNPGAASNPGGTIGGRGTQEEYQEARLRFMASGTGGVTVSADSISLDEGQIGSLVTASFDEL